MNREILFKAKRIDNGEWVEGYYVYCRKRHYILPVLNKAIGFDEREDEWVEVDPDTICQYTGLTDKNGKKIWENDLLGHKLNRVEFLNGTYCINGDRSLFFEANTNEVIGNIFDNQEMLEVE